MRDLGLRWARLSLGMSCVVLASLLVASVSARAAALPDNRIYEMVTPPNNNNADVYVPEFPTTQNSNHGVSAGTPFQASQDGGVVTYSGDPGPGGSGASGGGIPGFDLANQYLAVRTPSGWSQQDITPLGRLRTEYEAFSPDLSSGVLAAGGKYNEKSPLLPEAPTGARVLYARNDSDGSLRALYTSLPAGVEPSEFAFGVTFAGSSEAFTTLLLEAPGPLIEGAPAGRDLYAWNDGRLRLINTLPGGAAEPQAAFGAPPAEGSANGGSADYSHDISTDGSRIFWTGLTSHDLYLSEAGKETVQIDASKIGGSGGGGRFWTASTNGTRVFFTDEASAMLTDDTVPDSGANLYEYQVETGTLTDLTPAADVRVQGVIGVSDDGSYVYFAADGRLAEGAQTGTCHIFEEYKGDEQCNLYVLHSGVTKFVARLSERDGINAPSAGAIGAGGLEGGDWTQGLGQRTAEVTPSGEHVVFLSTLDLTGYGGERSEVYVYDAPSGELSCASCDPSGQAAPAVSPTELEQPDIGGALPASSNRTRSTRWISDSGDQVFFDSVIPLVPQDTNGLVDVYEWERDGSGDCHTDGGCVYLLSGGKSEDDSYLLDVSLSGSDVFFASRATLVASDTAGLFALYDATSGGVPPQAQLSCSGTGCQGAPPAPPIFATPSSVTFNGVGNFLATAPVAVAPKAKPLTQAQKLARALRVCRKDRGGKRTACEKLARRRYSRKQVTRSAKGRKQ
jgi:hypothetical protein